MTSEQERFVSRLAEFFPSVRVSDAPRRWEDARGAWVDDYVLVTPYVESPDEDGHGKPSPVVFTVSPDAVEAEAALDALTGVGI